MKNTKPLCILCRGDKLKLVAPDFNGIVYGKPDGTREEAPTDIPYDIWDCETCKSRFAYPYRFVDYEKLYMDSPIYKGLDNFAKEIRDSEDPIWKLISRGRVYFAVLDFLKDKSKVNGIDVGCGYGYLTNVLRRMGHNFVGTEVSKSVVDKCIEIYGNNYYHTTIDNISHTEEDIDLIVALEVIEHVPNPLELIRDAKRLVKAGGSVLITTPDIDFYRQQTMPGGEPVISCGWAGELPPIHFSLFSRDSMKWIAKELNMDIDFTVFPGGQAESMGVIFTKHD